MVDDQGDIGIFADVLQPFEFAGRGAFRFLVDGRIEMLAVEDKADRDDMGLAGFVRCRQMGDAGGAKKA